MWTMGVLDQNVGLESSLTTGDKKLTMMAKFATKRGLQATLFDDSILIDSPLCSVKFWPTEEMAIAIVDHQIVDTVGQMQASNIFSLLHLTEEAYYRVNIQNTRTHTRIKVYQKIRTEDMNMYADYITQIDGGIFASIGLRPTPHDVAPEYFRQQLAAEVWKKVVYVHPEFAGIPHKFVGGQIVIEKVHLG